MAQSFPYTYTCEVCGGTFYSKVDPSGWHHHKCNKCSGKQYKDYPVPNTQPLPTYQPQAVPTTKTVYNNVPAQQVNKKEFNLDEYIMDIIQTYMAISIACDEAKLTIPVENICAWTTGALIQKGKLQ